MKAHEPSDTHAKLPDPQVINIVLSASVVPVMFIVRLFVGFAEVVIFTVGFIVSFVTIILQEIELFA